MLRGFSFFRINPWKFLFLLIFFSNFIFLFDADLVLIIILIFLFFLILFFSSFELKQFVRRERMELLQKFFLLINDSKKNYLILNKLYIFNLSFFLFFSNSLNFWFANNLIYRCLEFSKNINYFFDYIFELLFFIFSSQNSTFLIDDFRQKFFSY